MRRIHVCYSMFFFQQQNASPTNSGISSVTLKLYISGCNFYSSFATTAKKQPTHAEHVSLKI